MNCKPGDIAIIVAESPWKGRLVDILYAAPSGDFTLPDGYPAHHNLEIGVSWVVRFIGFPAMVPVGIPVVRHREAFYGFGPDHGFKPIRGNEIPEALTNETELSEVA